MESILSHSDLKEVIKNKFKCSVFEVVEWKFNTERHYSGLYGLRSKEYVAVKLNDEQIFGLHIFVRQIPSPETYHGKFIEKLGAFTKETMLYDGLLKELKTNLEGKVYPECHLTRKSKLVILEDLNILGFKRVGITNAFSLEQIESTLQTMSKLHAGSIILEEKTGVILDQKHSDALFETYFVSDINHPWFHNSCTSINAIEAIVEAYFPHTSPEVCEKAYDILRSLPNQVTPSRKYRNVLSHGCITSSNVLFKLNEDNGIIESVLTGFQHTRYNTPALDVLLAIFLTTNNTLRSNNLEPLLVYYYNNLSHMLKEHGIDLKVTLPWKEFNDSIQETLQTALAMSIIHLHILLLPIGKISRILKSDKDFQEFIETDRTNIVLEEMRNNNVYRKRMIQALSDLFELIQKK